MSKQAQPAIDPNALMAQVELLRQRLAQLEAAIAELERARLNTARARETIKASSENDVLLAPTDPDYNAIIKVRVEEKDKSIIRLGENIYVKLPSEQAIQILEDRERILSKRIGELKAEHAETVRALEAAESLLQQAALAAQAAVMAGQKGEKK
ncbi:MAG: hypothetical protein LRS48_00910 [Desulfurococcales archaeon]|nr:hypothetical protein [Desulfurococcales archaeon]